MKRVLFAMGLGAILGALDGATAWFTPAAREQIGTIMMLSSLKSVIAGFLIGIFAGFVKNRNAVVVFGLAMGLLLAYLVAMSPDPKTGQHYYAQIMIPGSLVGLILGYATHRYATASQAARA